MSSMTTVPRGRALTREDFDALPDDGWRHELIDGSLLMTPAPSRRHQAVLARLHLLLEAHRPADLLILFAPFDVVLAEDTIVEPDLLVARKDAFTDRDLPGAPLLAVEVLSPSTRHVDLHLKRGRYESAACDSYWVVDPDRPSVTVWQLEGGVYREILTAVGDEDVSVERPFSVSFRPAELLL